MAVRFTSYVSAIILTLLAALISTSGGVGAGSCFVGAIALALTGSMTPRLLPSH